MKRNGIKNQNIHNYREIFTKSHKHLRRARRLYFRLVAKVVIACSDNTMMDYIIKRMIAGGLYAKTSCTIRRDNYYRVARALYMATAFAGEKWSDWCVRNNFSVFNFSKIQNWKKTA